MNAVTRLAGENCPAITHHDHLRPSLGAITMPGVTMHCCATARYEHYDPR